MTLERINTPLDRQGKLAVKDVKSVDEQITAKSLSEN